MLVASYRETLIQRVLIASVKCMAVIFFGSLSS